MPTQPPDRPPSTEYEPPHAEDVPADYPLETAAGAAGFIGIGYFGGSETARPSSLKLLR